MAFLLIFIIPAVNFLLFELFFFRPGAFYGALALSILLIIAAVGKITGKKIKEREFWNLCILPVLFSGSIAAYSLLTANLFLVHFLFALNFFFTLYYLFNIRQNGREEFLENVSAYGNFLTAFFIFSVIYGLKDFLNAPVWILILAAAAAVALIVYQVLWANKIAAASSAAYIFLSSLVITQLAWSLYFLPFNYNALGLILAACYYMLIGLVKSSLAGKLNPKAARLYLVFGLSAIFLAMLTANWS
jgi:hypothetical protein